MTLPHSNVKKSNSIVASVPLTMIDGAKNFLDLTDQRLSIPRQDLPVVDDANVETVVEPAQHSALGVYSPLAADETAWTAPVGENSMPEVFGSVPVATGADVSTWKTYSAFLGPGSMIAVGYMDPGNWSTDIAGGSAYGYSLLFIILMASLIAIFLQALAIRQGLATQRDLAQACRDSYPRWVVVILWVIIEAAVAATDLAEVIGSAVALKLLFGLPLIGGVCITAFDVLIILFTYGRNFRILEGLVALLVLLITVIFAAQIGLSKPESLDVMKGFLPSAAIFTNQNQLLIAIGIIGATVMPHNLFLHSSLVLTRNIVRDDVESVKEAMKYFTYDSTFCLICALFVNAAILIVAAAAFHVNGLEEVATLEEAHALLRPILGAGSSIMFAVALLAAGQNSTLTGTLAGQVVMEGFLNWKIRPVYRRLVTRLLAIVPAVIVISIGGDKSANDLLIISQVVLSVALPFAIFPLVHITSSKAKMGVHVNGRFVTILALIVAFVITGLDIFLFT